MRKKAQTAYVSIILVRCILIFLRTKYLLKEERGFNVKNNKLGNQLQSQKFWLLFNNQENYLKML